jgi:hypothetical protein
MAVIVRFGLLDQLQQEGFGLGHAGQDSAANLFFLLAAAASTTQKHRGGPAEARLDELLCDHWIAFRVDAAHAETYALHIAKFGEVDARKSSSSSLCFCFHVDHHFGFGAWWPTVFMLFAAVWLFVD